MKGRGGGNDNDRSFAGRVGKGFDLPQYATNRERGCVSKKSRVS